MPQWHCLLESADGLTAYRYINSDHLPRDIQTALMYDTEPSLIFLDASESRRFPITRLYAYHHTAMEGDTYVYREVYGWAEKQLKAEKEIAARLEVFAQRIIAEVIMNGQHELALEMNKHWQKEPA